MPRDSAGNFTLVPGNPVQSGTVVSSTWANSTLDDVSTALTDSLDRYGRGGMLAPFKFSDGTNLLPGAAWVNEPTTGFYRFDAGDLRAVVLTQDVMRWQSTGAQVWNSTDSQWNDIVGGGSGQTGVDPGTAADNTLRWSGTAWVETSDLTVSSTGVVSAEGGLESEGAGGGSFRAGTSAGVTSQGGFAVAIGQNAGNDTQSNFAVAIGQNAGLTTQGASGVSVGNQAGETDQGTSSVAVGRQAGETSQYTNAVAVGYIAGQNSQGSGSVAIGVEAGQDTQSSQGVAVGQSAGKTRQKQYGIGIGYKAGEVDQGLNSIAIGRLAGQTTQGNNGIIINASAAVLDDTTAGHIHIASDDGSLDFLTASGWSMSADLSVTGTVDAVSNVTANRGSIPGANAVLGRMQFSGYTVGTTNYEGTRINGKAAQLWTAANGGSKLEFEVTPNGTQTRAVGMTLEQDGSLSVTGTVDSDNGESVGSSDTGTPAQPQKMETLTQSEYDALSPTYDANTLYFIVG